MSGEGKVVGVTGASGYIASWLVKLLLQYGYTVKASVRDLNDPKKTGHLMSLDGAKERLQLFEANLLHEGSFDPMVDGCEGVFHTASPVQFESTDPQADLIEPAVKGTLNVLQACARVTSVKRVVLTSSVAALAFNQELKDGVVIDETWFSDPSYCKEHKLWYPLSKILAETAAWKFSKEHGIDMVVINPGLVVGPILQPSPSATVGLILNFVNGGVPYTDTSLHWVDVRDVANAHILALENPSANGRYCVIGRRALFSEAIQILEALYPSFRYPERSLGDGGIMKYEVSNEKVKGLGIDQIIPLEVSLKDTVESFKEMNLIGWSSDPAKKK